MDKIAVVILNWNGCDMLRSFLSSVVRFSEADGAVVYVADNALRMLLWQCSVASFLLCT